MPCYCYFCRHRCRRHAPPLAPQYQQKKRARNAEHDDLSAGHAEQVLQQPKEPRPIYPSSVLLIPLFQSERPTASFLPSRCWSRDYHNLLWSSVLSCTPSSSCRTPSFFVTSKPEAKDSISGSEGLLSPHGPHNSWLACSSPSNRSVEMSSTYIGSIWPSGPLTYNTMVTTASSNGRQRFAVSKTYPGVVHACKTTTKARRKE